MSENPKGSLEDKPINYGFIVGEKLFRKIETSLEQILLDEYEKPSKQKWILNAIKAKLKQEKVKPENEIAEIAKGRQINLRLSSALNKELDEQVTKIRKIRKASYSKKQWILEAILTRLEQEEKKNLTATPKRRKS